MDDRSGKLLGILLGLFVLLLAAVEAQAVRIDLERPGEREFVRDLAGMIAQGDVNELPDAPITID